jgi:SAM-dependent methyltransferase
MPPEVHPAAAIGFDRSPEAYERGRPDYPADAIAILTRELDLRRGIRVLDLAAGTGKLTRSLVATGATVLAVEPVAGMRDTLHAGVPAARTIGGLAEAIPLADGRVDAATVAQAFHWFDATRAAEELHRVLRPDAALALIWNVRDDEAPIQAALTALIEPYREETPGHRTSPWRESPVWATGFTPIERTTVRHEQRLDADGVATRVSSISFIARLPAAERASVEDRARALVPPGAVVALPYRTDLWIARRR